MAKDYASLQRRPFLTPLWLSFFSAVVAMGCLMVAAWVGWVWITANSTTVIVVREAESETSGEDPPLTPAGTAHAELLSRMLGDTRAASRLEAVYASPERRGRMTAAPLASRLGVTPIVAAASLGPGARSLVRRVLREQSGGRALVIARSDTLTEIVRELSGGGYAPSMAPQEYGTMYIVSVPRVGRANVLLVSY